MNRSLQTATIPDESALRTWDDMRSEVLHELSDGAPVADAAIELMSQLAVQLKYWHSMMGVAATTN